MKKQHAAKHHRRSLREIYFHHILWGVVSLVLLCMLLAFWFYAQTLNQKNVQLQREIATRNSLAKSCTAREQWVANTTKTFETSTPNGSRKYDVHLPADYVSNKYYPVIMYFPGKGMTAVDGEKSSDINRLPVIAVYPHPTIGKDSYWSWESAPYSSGVDDITFASDILDKVQSDLCVDRARIYAAGLSNGGGMVSLLSCRLPDTFAAFGIVAGAVYYPTNVCTPDRATPLISIHGDHDVNVPYYGSTARKLPPIETWMADRAKINDCAVDPIVTNSDALTTVTTWQFCRDGATVQNVRMNGGGHIWDAKATDTLWNFMSRFSL